MHLEFWGTSPVEAAQNKLSCAFPWLFKLFLKIVYFSHLLTGIFFLGWGSHFVALAGLAFTRLELPASVPLRARIKGRWCHHDHLWLVWRVWSVLSPILKLTRSRHYTSFWLLFLKLYLSHYPFPSAKTLFTLQYITVPTKWSRLPYFCDPYGMVNFVGFFSLREDFFPRIWGEVVLSDTKYQIWYG